MTFGYLLLSLGQVVGRGNSSRRSAGSVQLYRALAVEVHDRDVGVEGVEDRRQGLAAVRVLRWPGVPGVHIDDEVGVSVNRVIWPSASRPSAVWPG